MLKFLRLVVWGVTTEDVVLHAFRDGPESLERIQIYISTSGGGWPSDLDPAQTWRRGADSEPENSAWSLHEWKYGYMALD